MIPFLSGKVSEADVVMDLFGMVTITILIVMMMMY